ncbi:helix-turn-helix domain-containing protein [Pseudonocardia kujensis]|uniref:helix-turn-helix domain-containing protein n=1 Tax=Pseudonocardia kujensis TaxID=1128675 RepID=UPI001E3A9382|nr:helix-turn-helix domain-containing protein [Pseudonocardia kujensis]MCE0767068.1 helix-turn-helix domain-containing protein [Pseudonocardia kujensis]
MTAVCTGPQEYSLAGVAEGDREELWEQVVSESHAPMRLRFAAGRPGRPFHGVVRRRPIGDLELVDCESDPCDGVRSRSRIGSADDDLIGVLVTRSGGELMLQGEHGRRLRPGDLLVWEGRLPARFSVRGRFAKRTLITRRSALDEVLGRGWSVGGRPLDGREPAARLFVSYLDLLAGTGELPPAAVAAARNATLELVAGLVRATEEAPPHGRGLRAAMEGWIDRHLGEEITPAAIAAAHGVSVRTVYRAFEDAGDTVGAHVRGRRLLRARAELAAGSVPVAVIARNWGFSDSSHFSRAFRARFGTSPSAYRAALRPR